MLLTKFYLNFLKLIFLQLPKTENNKKSLSSQISYWNDEVKIIILQTTKHQSPSILVCDLIPASKYNITVQVKHPVGLYYSDIKQSSFSTCSAGNASTCICSWSLKTCNVTYHNKPKLSMQLILLEKVWSIW